MFFDLEFPRQLQRPNITSVKSLRQRFTIPLQVFICQIDKPLDDPNHRLNELVPRLSSHLNYNLRKEKNLLIPKFFSDRFRNSCIVSSCLNDQN